MFKHLSSSAITYIKRRSRQPLYLKEIQAKKYCGPVTFLCVSKARAE